MLFGGAAAALIVIVVVIALIVKGCSGRTDALAGTWDFDGTTTYEFDGNGTGAMVLPSISYDFTYTIDGNKLVIDYSNESVDDSTYEFTVDGDIHEGWMAEHMLILKLTNPEGKVKYVTGAFPSACGKTNLAMLIPTIPGWKVETIGDDISWMKFGKDGRLYAINPENGFFGVAPGTSMKSNKNAMLSCAKETIFTNCALRPNGDIWWEGMDVELEPGEKLIDWKGNVWEMGQTDAEGKPVKAAHPNARFSARAKNCPAIAPNWEDPAGVPIDAFLFGGRRPSTLPLVYQALSWEHGVMIGSSVGSEVTAAALDVKAGTVRRDPFAMLPFCGYNMGDYFKHWLDIGKVAGAKLPKIFCVNWFRKTADGKWLWPGFGDNSRVLKWVFERCDGEGKAVETPIGYMPTVDAIDRTGIENEVTEADMKELLSFDREGWLKELEMIKEHYKKFDRLPKELTAQLEALEARLAK